jgi:hypothetical protein
LIEGRLATFAANVARKRLEFADSRLAARKSRRRRTNAAACLTAPAAPQ